MELHTIQLPQVPAAFPRYRPGISLCMIVRDEEHTLRDCLASVRGLVDEVCIVDTGSVDGTAKVIADVGALAWFPTVRRKSITWTDDFSAARNVSLAMAKHAWTLTLDADERLELEGRDALLTLRDQPGAPVTFHLRIRNAVAGVEDTHAVMSHSLPRLFATHPGVHYRGSIHEVLTVPQGWGSAALPVNILHDGYRGDLMERKKRRNGPLLLAAAEREPDNSFAQFNVGNYYLATDNVRQGIEHLQRMRELEEGKEPRIFVPTGLLTLAAAYAKVGQFTEAHACADEALAIAPNYTLALFAKGEVYAAQGRKIEARAYFERTIESGQTYAERLYVTDEDIVRWKTAYNIGVLYAQEGRYRDAMQWLERALVAQPKVEIIRTDFLRCAHYEALRLLHTGDPVRALQFLGYGREKSERTNAGVEFAVEIAMWYAPDVGHVYANEMLEQDDPETWRFMRASLAYRSHKYDAAFALLDGMEGESAGKLRAVIRESQAAVPPQTLERELCALLSQAAFRIDASAPMICDLRTAQAAQLYFWRIADAASLLHYASGHEGALVSSQHYDAAADMLTAALLGKEDAARAMAHALITPEAGA